MTIVNPTYLIPIIIIYILIVFYLIRRSIIYKRWIEDFWSLTLTKRKKFSKWLYLISLLLFLLSLLDFRGREEIVRGNIPDQRTIIAIDNSLSMLAEDVRPNRYLKAIQIARHFVKNSPGHQFSIVVFSDIQKRLLPFTDDIDLIDSRLAALEKVNSVGGGSNISQSIQEIVNYFETSSEEELEGNLLLFTDGEESEESFDLKISPKINLAIIGIGTAKGSVIPLRYEDGSFRGYKESKGQQVVTALEEKSLEAILKEVKNSKLIIANSYSLPTDEIKSFFRSQFKKRHGNSDMRIRPVKSHYILVPAILIYVLSVITQFGKNYTAIKSIFILLVSVNVLAQPDNQKSSKTESPMTKELQEDLSRIKNGKANRNEILKTAENLLKGNKSKEAEALYDEYAKSGDEYEIQFNKITSKLMNSKLDSALADYQSFLKSDAPKDLKEKIRHNMLLSLKNEKENQNKKNDKNKDQEQKEEDNQDNNKDQDKDQGQNQQKNDEEKDGKGGKNNNSENKDQGSSKEKNKEQNKNNEQQDQKPKNEGEDKKDNKENKDKNKEDKGNGEDKKQEDMKPQSLEEKEKKEELRRKMTKLPGMIKQIMNDDRDLQKKLMDTSTKEKKENKPKRDW